MCACTYTHTRTHTSEILIESESRPRSSEKVFNSIKQNYGLGGEEKTFNGLFCCENHNFIFSSQTLLAFKNNNNKKL